MSSLRFSEYLTGGARLADPIQRPQQMPAFSVDVSESGDQRPFERGFDRICRKHLNASVAVVEFPGGRGRASAILRLTNGRAVVATLRNDPSRATIEYEILTRLSRMNAPVPTPYFFNGAVLLQEALPGIRLAESISADAAQTGATLIAAIESLHLLHERGSAAGLDAYGPLLGNDVGWIDALMAQPSKLGDYLGMPAPSVRGLEELIDLLSCFEPRFVRWDARPGNAMVVTDETIGWFDFEHAGARNRLDDLVWLLADETMPVAPDLEEALLDAALPAFADGRGEGEARAYFHALGMFHCVVRLGILLYRKGDGPWQDADALLREDQALTTLDCATALCRRGERWAQGNRQTLPYVTWWRCLPDALASLDVPTRRKRV